MTGAVRAVVLGVWFVSASAVHATSLEGSVSIDGHPASQTVVYLERAAGAVPPPAPPPHVVMDQKNLTFVPGVLPVVRGTVIEFTNSDDVQHNVFSPSAISGKFDLGTYGPGATRAVTLNEPGDVRVLCNIHMEMEAHILVLEDPYFSTVDGDGHYHIADVPAGTYRVRVWHKRWLTFAQTVEVTPSASLTVDIATGK